MKTNTNIDAIVKKLEELLSVDFAKCEIVDGVFRSGDESYHLYRITGYAVDGVITIARDYLNGRYMAQFSCAEGVLDIFFAFATKQRTTIRWRYYFDTENDKYTQGNLDDWFLMEQASKTMTTLIRGTGVEDDGHEGHYYHTII